MKKSILFSMKSPFRDEFKIQGFSFGSGKKTLAIVGAMRGDEIQQQYVCSQMVRVLKRLEERGCIKEGHEIMVIPSANHYSMNIGKRFWPMDSTDINRMFPGYDLGETTQRIAAGVFNVVKEYEYGIQLASYYLPGEFIPHIRMMETGYQPVEEAQWFGLPYVYVKHPHPYDTALLNYNWQIWDTKAFSLYTGTTETLNNAEALTAAQAIVRFLNKAGIVESPVRSGFLTNTIKDSDLVSVKAETAGIFRRYRDVQDNVLEGDKLGEILDPYDGTVKSEVRAPEDGTLFFLHNKPLVLQNTLLTQIIRYRD